ncbi:hypothetical protein TWF694_010325 [Orbilia ellipsospora]|uniref:Uncharacterized protein n=1 Tax=Orbilia ellipsospora TaxID=2528407 RepID=A0AAV9XAP7_9PEZI
MENRSWASMGPKGIPNKSTTLPRDQDAILPAGLLIDRFTFATFWQFSNTQLQTAWWSNVAPPCQPKSSKTKGHLQTTANIAHVERGARGVDGSIILLEYTTAHAL